MRITNIYRLYHKQEFDIHMINMIQIYYALIAHVYLVSYNYRDHSCRAPKCNNYGNSKRCHCIFIFKLVPLFSPKDS